MTLVPLRKNSRELMSKEWVEVTLKMSTKLHKGLFLITQFSKTRLVRTVTHEILKIILHEYMYSSFDEV